MSLMSEHATTTQIPRYRRPEPIEVSNDTIDYDAAVSEARQIVERIDSGWMRLGELADKIEPRYGQNTLERFAREIGIAVCTLERRRDVFRAWREIEIAAPGRDLPYAVCRELATHPERAEIIRDNPKISKREARKIMREYREPQTASPPTGDGALISWQRSLLRRARKATELAEVESWAELDVNDCEFEVDPGVEQAVQQVIETWALIHDRLAARQRREAEHAEHRQKAVAQVAFVE